MWGLYLFEFNETSWFRIFLFSVVDTKTEVGDDRILCIFADFYFREKGLLFCFYVVTSTQKRRRQVVPRGPSAG
jgi:hypothetical protein